MQLRWQTHFWLGQSRDRSKIRSRTYSGIAAAMAESTIGAAAVGAMAEKEELFGKGLILTVIPETLVIFGLVIAILILQLAA